MIYELRMWAVALALRFAIAAVPQERQGILTEAVCRYLRMDLKLGTHGAE